MTRPIGFIQPYPCWFASLGMSVPLILAGCRIADNHNRDSDGKRSKYLVWAVAFSPDSKLVASGNEDNTVRLWDPKGQKELAQQEGHEDQVHGVAFSPDGKTLASGDLGGVIKLWVTKSWQVRKTFKHKQNHTCDTLRFTPDGKTLVSLGWSPNYLGRGYL